MKTNVEKVSGTEKRVTVEIPADEVARRITEGYAEVRQMVPIRGFRKGKAPMSMVRRLFRESVEADVAETLVKESLAEAVKRDDLKVLSMTKVEGAKITEGNGFSFTTTLEVVPEVDPVGYKGLPVVREKVEITEDQVVSALDALRESFSHYHAVEGRGAGAQDLLELTCSSASGGSAIEDARSANVLMGTGVPFGKEFEEKLSGAVAGDVRKFDIAFPDDFPDSRYSGKKVSFDVTVNAVREKALPPLDEDFAKNFKEVSGLADLKEKMRERLIAEADERSRRKVEEDIRSALLEKNAFDVPRTLVDRQLALMLQDTANRLASQGVDLKKINMDFDKMRERFAPSAERTVRTSLILDGVARKENVDVSYSELEAEMKEIAAASGMEFEKVRDLYGDEARLDDLRNRLIERKAMAFLLSNAQVTEEGGKS